MFSFLVSTLTFFQSWFLGDGNVVFFSLLNFFLDFSFILSSYANVCFIVLGSAAFQFSAFCFSFRLGGDTMSWIYAHTCIHTCVSGPILVCVCIYIYIYIRPRTCVCTHTHTHTHTYMWQDELDLVWVREKLIRPEQRNNVQQHYQPDPVS